MVLNNVILVPRATCFFLIYISSGPGNSKKMILFIGWWKLHACNKVKNICFYALNFTCGFHLEGEINNFSLLLLRVLRVVFSIETRPLRQQNQFFEFPRSHVACNWEISDICHRTLAFGKAAAAGKFENVTGYNKVDRYFSEKVLCTSSSTLRLNKIGV